MGLALTRIRNDFASPMAADSLREASVGHLQKTSSHDFLLKG